MCPVKTVKTFLALKILKCKLLALLCKSIRRKYCGLQTVGSFDVIKEKKKKKMSFTSLTVKLLTNST